MDKIGEYAADAIALFFVGMVYGVMSGWLFVGIGALCVFSGGIMVFLSPFQRYDITFGSALRTIFGGLFCAFIGLGIHHVALVK